MHIFNVFEVSRTNHWLGVTYQLRESRGPYIKCKICKSALVCLFEYFARSMYCIYCTCKYAIDIALETCINCGGSVKTGANVGVMKDGLSWVGTQNNLISLNI